MITLSTFRLVVAIALAFMSLSWSSLLAQTQPQLKSRLPQLLEKRKEPNPQDKPLALQALSKHLKISQVLLGLFREYQQISGKQAWQAYVKEQGYEQALILHDEKVLIEAVAEKDTRSLQKNLEAMGLEHSTAFGRMVSGLFPIAKLKLLADLESLRLVRAAHRPVRRAGSVVSQGDAAQGTDIARAICGLNGANTLVGILSDSYDALGGEARGIASGDLPGLGNPNGFVNPLINLSDVESGVDEGRALAEIVHDVAPGAGLAFHTALLGQANFANGILRLAEDVDADVIVDDILYINEPMFQDGIIAQAVDSVAKRGVTHVSAAGNAARNSYESEFRPSPDTVQIRDAEGFTIGSYVLHDFDPGPEVDVFQRITIPFETLISFQWSQAFASICPDSPGADSDLDIYIFTREGDLSSPIFGGIDPNIGGDPFESLRISTDFPTEVYIVIGKYLGDESFIFDSPDPELIKYVYFGGSLEEEHATQSASLFGHANAQGAIATGAVFYGDTPPFGQDDPLPEGFSAAGGTPILLSPCGEPIEPELRQKPELCGPDGVRNTFFGTFADDDEFPDFFGTSASAPHVAGIAALLKQAEASLSPQDIREILQNTALDMDDPFTPEADPGFDFGTGFGLVQGLEAISQVSTCEGIAQLELYNADTDERVGALSDGSEFSFSDLGTRNLAIRALSIPDEVGSVVLEISGDLSSQKLENRRPYTSFGDAISAEGQIDYVGRSFPFGTFEVKASAYSQANGQGELINTLRTSFSLLEEITSFTLVNALTDEDISEIGFFQEFDLNEIGDNLSIRADVSSEQEIGSVFIQLIDFSTFESISRVENIAPFTLFGNQGEDYLGESLATSPLFSVGATPFSQKDLEGTEGISTGALFIIFDSGEVAELATLNGEQTSWLVYPNPLQDQSASLEIRHNTTIPIGTALTFRLIDPYGEEVYRGELTSSNRSYRLDLRELNLKEGMYLLQVEHPEEGLQTIRILKN